MPAAPVVGRAEQAEAATTFRSQQEIVFGVGAEECVLEDLNFSVFRAPADCDPRGSAFLRPAAAPVIPAASRTLAGVARRRRRQRP
jgi:hypothetical protein